MKKISLLVCVLALCSLSLMAVKLDIEIEERGYNCDRKTILKETVHIEKDDSEAHICENSNGIGLGVAISPFQEKGLQVSVSSLYERKAPGNVEKKEFGHSYWLRSEVINIGDGTNFKISHLKYRKKFKVFIETSD